MSLPLIGRNCLVTGGSRGIGFAISKKLALLGANVCILGRSQTNLKQINLPISTEDQQHSAISWNVGESRLLTDAVIADKNALVHGNYKISETDILVNCAGKAQSSLLLKTSEDEISELFDINLQGTVLMSKSVLKAMIRRQKSHENCNIVNISSILASITVPGTCVYAAAKDAVNAFTKSLAYELKETGIRVNCISPGLVDTGMGKQFAENLAAFIPNVGNNMLAPEEIAEVCSKIILDEKRGTGQIISVKNRIKKK